MPKLSIVLPSWDREQLTIRMLNAVCLQTFDDYELFFLGDRCDVFDKIIKTEDFLYMKEVFKNRIIVKNFENHDGTSTQAINYAIENMTGEYFLFLSNDDLIFPNHFELYYNTSKSSNKDFCLFNTSIDHGDGVLHKRVPKLAPSQIGHSELCISKQAIKSLPQHVRVYGHDWLFVKSGLDNQCSFNFVANDPTYIVNLSHHRGHNWEAGRVV